MKYLLMIVCIVFSINSYAIEGSSELSDFSLRAEHRGKADVVSVQCFNGFEIKRAYLQRRPFDYGYYEIVDLSVWKVRLLPVDGCILSQTGEYVRDTHVPQLPR